MSQISFGAHPPQSAGHTHVQSFCGSHSCKLMQVSLQPGAHSHSQVDKLHCELSGQPPQSFGHSHWQSLAGLHSARPGQLSSQLGSQSQAHVDWLQTKP